MSSKKHSLAKPSAEVIQSSLATFTAQCWQWDKVPAFGQLVCTTFNDIVVYGVVSNITTGSTDPQRIPFAYQKTPEELKAQHPHIFEFLATTYTAIVVGFSTTSTPLTYATAPHPAPIHSFVHEATLEQKHHFFTNPSFLALALTPATDGPEPDELLLALCTTIAQAGMLTPRLFEQYYQTLSLLVGNDYRRLKVFLQRVSAQHPHLG